MSFFVDQNETILNFLDGVSTFLISKLPESAKPIEPLELDDNIVSSIKRILEKDDTPAHGGDAEITDKTLPEQEALEKRIYSALLFIEYVKKALDIYKDKVSIFQEGDKKDVSRMNAYSSLFRGFILYIQHVLERILFHQLDSGNVSIQDDVKMMATYYKILCDFRNHVSVPNAIDNEDSELRLLIGSVEEFLKKVGDMGLVDDDKMETLKSSSMEGDTLYHTLRDTLESININTLKNATMHIRSEDSGNRVDECNKNILHYQELQKQLIEQLNEATKLKNQIDYYIAHPYRKLNDNIKERYEKYRDNEFENMVSSLSSLTDVTYSPIDEYDPTLCKGIVENIKSLEQFSNLKQPFINFKEDLMGAVRVFVKVKPVSQKPNSEEKYNELSIKYPKSLENSSEENTMLNREGNKYIKLGGKETKGPFFNVFKPTQTNKDVFKEMQGMFDQIKDGYHIVIFGYGYSGAGKTFTLLNNSNDEHKGLLLNAIDYFKTDDIMIERLYELYIDNLTNLQNTPTLKGVKIDLFMHINPEDLKIAYEKKAKRKADETEEQIIEQHEKLPKQYPDIYSKVISFNSLKNNKDDNVSSLRTTYLTELIQSITKLRTDEGRIKRTINNPESSRSHLFITLKVGAGAITICDMGGRESPADIYNNTPLNYGKKTLFISSQKERRDTTTFSKSDYLSTIMQFDMKKTTIDKIKSDTIKNVNIGKIIRDDYRWKENDDKATKANKLTLYKEVIQLLQTCCEGYYINETVNHLTWYFNLLNGITKPIVILPKFLDYTSDMCFTDPEDNSSFSIQMISTLQDLNNLLGNSTKPTKFVMLACIRSDDEPKFVDFSQNTLEFAQNISSTIGATNEISNTQRRLPGIAGVALRT